MIATMTVKIFVGNIAPDTDCLQLRELFEQHGAVTECDVLGGYGFVHMDNEEIANEAIKALAGCSLNGNRLNIELSTATTQGRAKLAARTTSTVKIFVGNLSKSTPSERLRELFETYGDVSESDVLGGFGFVHMNQEQEAFKAIKALNGYILDGSRINVELSTGGTQGKSKEREVYGGRGIPTLPRSRAGASRYDPYPLPPIASRRPAIDPYDTYAYASQSAASSRGGGGGSGDSFARDLLELYIKNRAAFDAYANDPLVRKALNLPPVESDPTYYRTPPPPAPARDYYERRRLSELSASVSADPYASPSDYSTSASAYDSIAAGGRAWPGAGMSSSSYGGAESHSGASAAKGRGHLYTSFE